jgi:hypothetical protein
MIAAQAVGDVKPRQPFRDCEDLNQKLARQIAVQVKEMQLVFVCNRGKFADAAGVALAHHGLNLLNLRIGDRFGPKHKVFSGSEVENFQYLEFVLDEDIVTVRLEDLLHGVCAGTHTELDR